MQCILFNKNCVRKLKEKLCSKVKRKKKQNKKKIHYRLPFLYCIVAYQNVSKRIISILTNHIVWITSAFKRVHIRWAGFSLANFFVQSDFLLNSHWLATFFEVKKVGSNPTFIVFERKKSLHTKKFASRKLL